MEDAGYSVEEFPQEEYGAVMTDGGEIADEVYEDIDDDIDEDVNIYVSMAAVSATTAGAAAGVYYSGAEEVVGTSPEVLSAIFGVAAFAAGLSSVNDYLRG